MTSRSLWLFCPSGGAVGPPEAGEPTPRLESTPEEDPAPRPSKRLTVLTQCVWTDEAERSRVLKVLCQRMAVNRLDRPFWVGRHLIRPATRHVEGESGSADFCVHYKIHVSAPERRPARPLPTSASLQQVGHTCIGPSRHGRRGVCVRVCVLTVVCVRIERLRLCMKQKYQEGPSLNSLTFMSCASAVAFIQICREASTC